MVHSRRREHVSRSSATTADPHRDASAIPLLFPQHVKSTGSTFTEESRDGPSLLLSAAVNTVFPLLRSALFPADADR
jgi:hypothetical protein